MGCPKGLKLFKYEEREIQQETYKNVCKEILLNMCLY